MGAASPRGDLVADHAVLVAAVREAGALAMRYFGRKVERWDKRPGHPVCAADLAVDEALAAALRGARPGYGWLSEEAPAAPARPEARRVWIVDPIDGTRAFLAGRREFTVAAALVEDGAPVAAAVFNPATDELFEAVRGGGARLDGVRLRVSERRELAGARILMSRTERDRARWQSRLAETTIDALSSMAYKLALIAAGRYDATATLWRKSTWDVAAGDLLVREAGGRVSAADGTALRYDEPRRRLASVIAAGPALHAVLVERLGDGATTR